MAALGIVAALALLVLGIGHLAVRSLENDMRRNVQESLEKRGRQ